MLLLLGALTMYPFDPQDFDTRLKAMQQRINLLHLRLKILQMQQTATILLLNQMNQQLLSELKSLRQSGIALEAED